MGDGQFMNVLTRPFAISPDGQIRMEDRLIA